MERRVTAVELRPINLLPASAIPDENDDLDPGPDTVVGLDAPNQYKKVVGGYYYSSQITGVSKPRIELYFEADPGLDDDLTVRVSGIHNIRHSGDNVSIAGSGDFKTINSDRPPYENRAVYSGQRDTPDADTVAATVLYNPGSGTQYGLKKEVVYRARISTLEATTTTAKIVFTSTNPFEVGDVIYVDVRPDDGPFFGLDGLHKVASVGSNFITYSFSSSLEEPINVASVTDEVYVHAVAQSAIRDGATWISPTNVVYVWKDIRWVLFSSSSPITEDGVAPEAVTNLAATDENDTPDGSSNGLSRVTLTWDAPTLNTDGTTLDDLVGYTVWSRQLAQGEWEKYDFTGSETTWSKGGFQQGKRAYFKVFARDSGGNLSDAANLEYVTSVSVPTVSKPAAPAATTYLGTIKIAYDDLTDNGLVQANTAKEIQVYFSDIDGFTPGPDSYYGKFPANAGSYIIIPGTEIEDNTDYYIKIVVRDIYGNITDPSDQVSIRARKSEIVTFDMIDVGSLTAQAIVGLQISTSENASVDGGIVLTKDFLAAYDQGGNQTFRIDADDGSVSIGAYLGRDEADGFLTIANADLTYTTKITSNSIKLTADTAKETADAAAQTADTAEEKINDITEITPGGIRIRKAKAIQALNSTSATLSNNTTEIDGGVIRTGTILASQLGAGNLPVNVIYTRDLDADKITSGTVTGRTVRTASSGTRVVMSSTDNRFNVYEGSTLVGFIDGIANAGTTGIQLVASIGSARYLASEDGVTISASSSRRLNFSNTGAVSFVSNTNFEVDSLAHSSGKAYVFANAQGFLTSSTSTSGVSDARVKTDVSDSDLGLKFISDLKPVKFKWVDGENSQEVHRTKYQYGLLAQSVKESLEAQGLYQDTAIVQDEPDVASFKEAYPTIAEELDENPLLSLDYVQLTPILIKAVQEMSSKIDALELELKLLKDGDK
jgi:hypothetical protein